MKRPRHGRCKYFLPVTALQAGIAAATVQQTGPEILAIVPINGFSNEIVADRHCDFVIIGEVVESLSSNGKKGLTIGDVPVQAPGETILVCVVRLMAGEASACQFPAGVINCVFILREFNVTDIAGITYGLQPDRGSLTI